VYIEAHELATNVPSRRRRALTMYSATLFIHSWLRWAVILAGLVATLRALTRVNGQRPWTSGDESAGRWFVMMLDVQVLLGLIMYFLLSPFTRAALQDFGASMGNSGMRFWAVEHPFGMLIATALAHVGRVRTRKAPEDRRRHRAAAIFYTLALIAILISIPWPGIANGRPLFRW
jgi:hypothetical protein